MITENKNYLGITLNFPNYSVGIIFALIELSGSILNFVQLPV